MSDRNKIDARAIPPKALDTLGLETALVMLGVARDLRDGTIPPEQYDQKTYCGTACCIWGHTYQRLNGPPEQTDIAADFYRRKSVGLERLFSPVPLGWNRDAYLIEVTPHQAADAIEQFVLHGSDDPWDRQPTEGTSSNWNPPPFVMPPWAFAALKGN